MTSLLIVYHSQSGSCARIGQAALRGARLETDAKVSVRRASDVGVAEVALADGLLLIAAENSGSLNGGMKDFLDRVFYPAHEQGLVKPYVLLVSAGNDGRAAVRQAQKILSGIPLTPAAEPIILRGEPQEQHFQQASEAAQAFAAGLVMGIF